MKIWAILCAAMIGLIILAADTGHLRFLARVYDFPNGDKIGHFAIYGCLSLLVNLSAIQARRRRAVVRTVVICSLLLAVPLGLEEVSQAWIPARTFSLLDLAASYAGEAVFACLAASLWDSGIFGRRLRGADHG
jgi:hypothetical protein